MRQDHHSIGLAGLFSTSAVPVARTETPKYLGKGAFGRSLPGLMKFFLVGRVQEEPQGSSQLSPEQALLAISPQWP